MLALSFNQMTHQLAETSAAMEKQSPSSGIRAPIWKACW